MIIIFNKVTKKGLGTLLTLAELLTLAKKSDSWPG